MDEAKKQVAGIYRRRIGDSVVTVINDGFLDIPFEILRGVSMETLQTCMQDAFRPGPPRLTVNAFVVETQGRTILIDSGGGSTTIYSMGLLLENLRAAGYSPASIDTVLLTHIHPDHSNGLLTASGEAIFPRAEVMVHEDEIAFWSDPALDEAAPPAAKPYLGSARALFAAYRDQLRPARGGEVVAGITLLPLPGHTPGHSGYRLESAGESLVIWGDTVHVPEIQVPHPVVTSEFDIDESLAAENRARIFRMVAEEGLLVAGMHLHLPAFAHLAPDGDGFRLVPEPWAVAL